MSLPTEVYQSEKRFLWGLCYRMTANAADADDLVQETFVKALEKPPRSTAEPWRPWLVTVALNLSRDHLRRRRRTAYKGPWLPSPIPTDEPESEGWEPVELLPHPDVSPATRYDRLESVSFAFLLALEALTPMQRAVLLLRDVFDYSTIETATVLGTTEVNVKVTLHRARRAMEGYDKSRIRLSLAHQAMTKQALEQFLYYLSRQDMSGLERLLTEDVVEISDGGGEVPAAFAPIRGRDRVLRFFLSLARQATGRPQISFRLLNGLPAVLFEWSEQTKGRAAHLTMHCDLDETGRIRRLHTVLAPSKLTALWNAETGTSKNEI